MLNIDVTVDIIKLDTVAIVRYRKWFFAPGNGFFRPYNDEEIHVFTLPLSDLEKFKLTIKNRYSNVMIYEEESYFEKKGQEDFQEGQQSQLNEFSPCQ